MTTQGARSVKGALLILMAANVLIARGAFLMMDAD